jgi:hypothetical protein
MNCTNKYSFEARDFNILTNQSNTTPLHLPQLPDRSFKLDSRTDSPRGINIKNACSVDYDPISKLKSANLSYKSVFLVNH